MIVDDTKLIMGSANLNDRSMLGYRDSELAILVEGPLNLQINAKSDQKSYHFKVNKSIYEFRMNLFERHFGLHKEELMAPHGPVFWKQAINTAALNTAFYEAVFNCYPSNRFHNWKDFLDKCKYLQEDFDEDKFEKYHGLVKGNVVLYPYNFLKNEGLKKSVRNGALLVVPVRALF